VATHDVIGALVGRKIVHMAIYLDEPLDDEPLFGVVARYLERTPWINKWTILTRLFGESHGATHLRTTTGRIALETKVCWGMSAEELAVRMTMHPYYAAFASAERAKELLEGITGTRRTRPGGLGSGSEGTIYRHRYCRSCLADNKRSGEPLHWRRAHQLPGVIICIRHEELLWEWEYSEARRGFVSPNEVLGKPIPIKLTVERKSAILQVARISNDILNNNVTVDIESFHRQFRGYFEGRSRYFSGTRHDQCMARLLEMSFGKWFVDAYSIDLGRRKFANVPHVSGISTLRFIAAATLILRVDSNAELLADKNYSDIYDYVPSELIRSRLDNLVRRKPPPSIECPSKVANHRDGHLIEHWRWVSGAYSGRCSCGLTTRYAEDANGNVALSITGRGEFYKREVIRLSESGASARAIGYHLGIPKPSVEWILRRAGILSPAGARKRVRVSIECPSVLAPHGRGHEIDHMKWNRGKYHGKCCCGVAVICEAAADGTYFYRVHTWGELYISEVQRLTALGLSGRVIARQLGVSSTMVFRYMKLRRAD